MWSRLLVIAACTIAPASAAARRNDPDATLTAQDVQRYFAPHLASVRSCYLAHGRGKRADGSVRLELIIHPNGSIHRFDLVAPGVDPPWLGKLDRCVRALVPTWHLPPRKGFTTAIIPFLFHKTSSPGAGPIESCWDPRGCPPGKQGGT